jgi:hypothetical protein
MICEAIQHSSVVLLLIAMATPIDQLVAAYAALHSPRVSDEVIAQWFRDIPPSAKKFAPMRCVRKSPMIG